MKNLLRHSFFSITPFVILVLLSAKITTSSSLNIIGHWTYESTSEEGVQYKAGKKFDAKEGGIAFMKNGKLIKRQNAGWCGTPPISYRNYEGKWNWIDKNTIAMTYPFWGGTIDEEWDIVSIEKGNIIVKRISFETREDFERK